MFESFLDLAEKLVEKRKAERARKQKMYDQLLLNAGGTPHYVSEPDKVNKNTSHWFRCEGYAEDASEENKEDRIAHFAMGFLLNDDGTVDTSAEPVRIDFLEIAEAVLKSGQLIDAEAYSNILGVVFPKEEEAEATSDETNEDTVTEPVA